MARTEVATSPYQAYLEASSRYRAQLVLKAKKRGPIILDRQWDDIAGYMIAWRKGYLDHHRKRCGKALCDLCGDPRDNSVDYTRCQRCHEQPATFGGLCGNCGQDLHDEFMAWESDPDNPARLDVPAVAVTELE
jgi:hypothetical protein